MRLADAHGDLVTGHTDNIGGAVTEWVIDWRRVTVEHGVETAEVDSGTLDLSEFAGGGDEALTVAYFALIEATEE